MRTQKIKADEHSVYVIVNGSYHRPVPSTVGSKGPVYRNGAHRYVQGTWFNEGDEVVVKNINGTPCSWVGDCELWTTHGVTHTWEDACNRNGGRALKVPSTDAWRPR